MCAFLGNSVLIESLLTLTIAVFAPPVCVACILLIPFSDRVTQVMLLASEAAYISLAVLL